MRSSACCTQTHILFCLTFCHFFQCCNNNANFIYYYFNFIIFRRIYLSPFPLPPLFSSYSIWVCYAYVFYWWRTLSSANFRSSQTQNEMSTSAMKMIRLLNKFNCVCPCLCAWCTGCIVYAAFLLCVYCSVRRQCNYMVILCLTPPNDWNDFFKKKHAKH